MFIGGVLIYGKLGQIIYIRTIKYMANEFKKGSFNISLPNVTANSTLVTEETQQTYIDNLTETGFFSLNPSSTTSNSHTISVPTNTKTIELFVYGSSGTVSMKKLYVGFNSAVGTDVTNFISLNIGSASTFFFHLKLTRVSAYSLRPAQSNMWCYTYFYNFSTRGNTSIVGSITSSLSSSNPFYQLGYNQGSVTDSNNLGERLSVSYNGAVASGTSASLNIAYVMH